MRRSPWLRVAFALWPLSAAGCVTPSLWERANAREVTFDRLAGSVHGRSLVVRYTDPAGGWSTLLVPLQPDGRPAWPFRYDGPARSADAIRAAVSPAQRQAVLAQAGPVADGDSDPEMAPADVEPDPKSYSEPGWAAAVIDGPDVVAAAFRWDHQKLVAVSARCRSSDDPLPYSFPPDKTILIVPDARPRPSVARRRARTKAALLTPVTLAVDGLQVALAVPLLPIGLVFGGAFCP